MSQTWKKNSKNKYKGGSKGYDSESFDDDYENEFEDDDAKPKPKSKQDKNHKWNVIVYTKSKKDLKLLADGASVNLKIIGDKASSDLIKLDNMNDDSYQTGSTEKFDAFTNEIGKPTHIVVNYKDAESSYEWYLNKIELVDVASSKTYRFTLNDKVKRSSDVKIALDGNLIW